MLKIFICVFLMFNGLVISLIGQKFQTSRDSISYIMGMSLAENWKKQGISQIEPDIIALAIKDVMEGKPSRIDKEAGDKLFRSYATLVRKNQLELVRSEGKAYMQKNALNPKVTTLPSGLQYEILSSSGSAEKPKLTDKVTVHYHGTLINGQVFDSSVDRKTPSSFNLQQVIKGWTEGLQLMSVGDKYKFTIPAELAYGDRAQGAFISPGSTLIFEVELLGINK